MQIDKFPFLYIYKHYSGNEIYFAIDRLVQGKCTGGIRVREGIEPGELLDNARLMSKKLAVANIPCGGAKLGVNLKNPREKDTLLSDFGRRISSLLSRNIFIPGVDMSSNPDDVKTLRGCYSGKYYRLTEEINSSFYTAYGVYVYLKIIKKRFFPDSGKLNLAMEGCGKVGSSLLGLLCNDKNFRLKYISDKSGAFKFRDKNDIDFVLKEKSREVWKDLSEILPEKIGSPKDLKYLDIDILIPGAVPEFILPEDIDRIKARAIIPNSNHPFHFEAIPGLKKNNIIFIPEYLPNCAGVFGALLGNLGFNPFYVRYVINKHFNLVFDFIYKEAVSPENIYETAERLIEAKLNTPLWKGGLNNNPVHRLLSRLSDYFNLFPRNIRRRFVTTWYLPHSAMWSWKGTDIDSFKI
ncbi:MAG TPA: hypothetical protein ENN73_06865 [Firmicutes bacterium]|nr:hypothetical protein [Bacillota bacterium]